MPPRAGAGRAEQIQILGGKSRHSLPLPAPDGWRPPFACGRIPAVPSCLRVASPLCLLEWKQVWIPASTLALHITFWFLTPVISV